MPARESGVSRRIIDWLNKQPNIHAVKMEGNYRRGGQPDIFSSVEGYAVLFEVKAIGKVMTTRQQAEAMKWRRAKTFVFTVYSVRDVQIIILSLRRLFKFKDEVTTSLTNAR